MSECMIRQRGCLLVSCLALLLATSGAACSREDSRPSEPTRSQQPPLEMVSSGPSVRLVQLTDELDESDELNLDALPRQVGEFGRDDLRAFAGEVLQVAERGISPRLSGMTPERAVEWVLAGRYASSWRRLGRLISKTYRGHDWAWVVASQFAREPAGDPKILQVKWQTSQRWLTYVDGSNEPILRVSLRVFSRHDVPLDGALRPIVIERTYRIEGSAPSSPRGEVGVGVSFQFFGDDKCATTDGSKLRPSRKRWVLRADVKALKESLRSRIWDGMTTATTREDVQRDIKSYGCTETEARTG